MGQKETDDANQRFSSMINSNRNTSASSMLLIIGRRDIIILMTLSIIMIWIFFFQVFAGLWNLVRYFYEQSLFKRRARRVVFNVYLFHHLVICLVRCTIIFFACLSIIVTSECLNIELVLHFLLLLSTFDLLLMVIGESVHFWDSAINRKSTLHSKCCLIFGILFNYFVSSLFISIHITMSGDHPMLMELCQTKRKRFFLIPRNSNERSLIPTLITYMFFILLDLLTCAWIYISYRDISNIKEKRLVTLFFHSLVFTRFKDHERTTMVNRSLRRLRVIILSVLSNIFVILPVLTIKIFDISLSKFQRMFLVYFTMLPWLDCLTFLSYDETRLNGIGCCPKNTSGKTERYQRQRIGRRLSAYRDFNRDLATITEISNS